jgi:hypothetical protein
MPSVGPCFLERTMMKPIFPIIMAVLMLSAGGVARAEEEKDGTDVTAAVKMWVNEWKHDDPSTGRKISDSVIVLVGPAVEVKLKNHFVLEGSYLVSASDYQFTEAGVTSEFDRRDLELGIGKWFNRYSAFFVGYRNSSFENKATGIKEFFYGEYYSIRGEVPFIGKSLLYGNVTYLTTRFKPEGQAREDAPGWITEIGGTTRFSRQVAMKLGYKWETTKRETSKVTDSFSGTTIEITYTF